MPNLLDTLLAKKPLAALAIAAVAGLVFGFVEGLIIAFFTCAALMIVGNLREAKRGFDRFDENLQAVWATAGAAGKATKAPAPLQTYQDAQAETQSELEAWYQQQRYRQQWDRDDEDLFRSGDEAFSPEYSHLIGNSWHRDD